MNKASLFLLPLLCLFSLPIFSQLNTNSCEILRKGTFMYTYNKKKVKVVIDKDRHTEYHENGKYVIHSKLFWVNDCEYVTTCLKTNFPNPAYGKDDQMLVQVTRIHKNTIYFTTTINRLEWKGKMVKVE